MTAAALSNNIAAFTSPFDAANSNSAIPPPAQLAGGFIPNVDIVKAEQQNYLHGASTTWIYLAQLMGLILPFNPVAGASIVATPNGGIVSLTDDSTGDTQFYVAKTDMAVGYTDPSLDPTNWSLVDFGKIATQTGTYAAATGTANAIVATFTNIVYPVLTEGFQVVVGITALNTTSTPTLQVVLNGSAQTARTIVKYVGGVASPLAGGDLQGRHLFSYDLANTRWILLNPASGEAQPGDLLPYSGSSVPSGYLACPTTVTLVSTTTYAGLFAAIGYAWGGSGGSFGLPYFPTGYVPVQGTVANLSHGALLAHTHVEQYFTTGATAYANITTNGTATTSTLQSLPYSPLTASTGGADNLAAGMGVKWCVKF